MVLLGIVALLALAPSVLSAITPKPNKIVPGGYIVEFKDNVFSESNDGLLSDLSKRTSLTHIQLKSDFYDELVTKNMAATHRMDLSSSIFNGVSFHVDPGLDQAYVTQNIKSMPNVRKIWPITLYSTQDIPTPRYNNGTNSSTTGNNESTHIMGRVDRLHAEGLTGNGTFVAIIDTGVDYNHEALGGCFGKGCKVAYGYDFVGDDYNGTNIPVADSDPYSACNDHGTHVAGIVGANPNPYNFTGVVPDATLGAYRVFGCDGSSGDDVLIAAFTRAFEDGADIITASIGGANGWTEQAWSVAVSRIVAAGTPCTLAAGNDGMEGLFYGSSAADGIGVIAVGSIDNVETPLFTTYGKYTVNDGPATNFGYLEASIGMPSNVTLPVFSLNYNTSVEDDACTPLPADTPDLAGKFVLIRRGGCTFDEKAASVAAFGAQYVLFYNNAPDLISGSMPTADLLGAAMVTPEQGATWISALKANSSVIASITGGMTMFSSSQNNLTGGYMSTFSMWNPTNEVYIKPEISAPGGNILSTLPLSEGGYGVLSGTSMATPFVAGVVAIMLEVKPDLDPLTIRSILGTTGSPVNFNDGESTFSYLAPVVQQGGGLIDAFAAVHTSTILSDANLSFNDSAHFVPEANFTITNRGSVDITYTISYKDAATAYTLPDDGTTQPQVFPPELVSTAASLSFSSSKITVAAGKSETVLVTLNPPPGLATKRIPVYSGFIGLKASNGDDANLPYAGVASSLRDATVLDASIGYPYLSALSDSDMNPVPAGTVFTISIANTTDVKSNATGLLIPDLVIGLSMPSALIRADLVVAANSTQGVYANATTILGEKVIGEIMGSPWEYQPRANTWDLGFYGTLNDGRRVPEGSYQILVRALRIFGDRTEKDDYDAVRTVPFTIKYVA